ncbi:membrane fusion protein, multidrug efflux system [Duganella sp. CF458]|uniref:efflux RND transporter periplasmic adaptor subunit n=1 Tax=Duganella sp. CF458 TaxID=1884368 RepID=UPI0008E7467D|nr:efflux RND transporter periplasmic adaptor subunit [Duganella sp. CF458]SFG13204.1 membrane fusion protein, multidrug efflux system [Duganella sp. CF458]
MNKRFVFLACAAALIAGCESQPAAQGEAGPPQVGVHTVQARQLPVNIELPGRTAAFMVAEVRPQVGGLVQKRLFLEGADVNAGTQLYQIDSAIYQANYNSAKATLKRAEANLLAAAPKAQRYKDLLEMEGVSRQEYDDAVAGEAQARAERESAKAALDAARINLDFTKVQAPISGRISRSSVTPGALVTAGQEAALATVQQLDPIYVDVTQSGEEMRRLKKLAESGALKQAGGQARVMLKLSDGTTYAHEGKLQFAGSSVDPGTGNVILRAIVPNPKHELMPGMFVRAAIESGIDEHAIAVPQQGVTRNPKGEATALVLNDKGIVEQRVLQTSGTLGDLWLVKSGLKVGDRVIVEGHQKVQPGAPAVFAQPKPAVALTPSTAPQ